MIADAGPDVAKATAMCGTISTITINRHIASTNPETGEQIGW